MNARPWSKWLLGFVALAIVGLLAVIAVNPQVIVAYNRVVVDIARSVADAGARALPMDGDEKPAPAVSEPTQMATPTPTPTPTPPPTPTSAATPSEAAIAPGSLGDLDSYRYSMTMELEGLESVISESLGALTGEATTAPETMEIEISGAFVAPDKAEIHMRISGLDDELAMTIIGNQQWVKLGDLAMGPLEFTEDISEMDFALAMWEGFSQEADGLTCTSERRETVDDVPARYCGIDRATFERPGSLFGGTEEIDNVDELSLDMWLAEDGGWPVRLRVYMAGTDESGQEFEAKLEMEITDVNEQIEIKPPS
jgi:hypothetical protein